MTNSFGHTDRQNNKKNNEPCDLTMLSFLLFMCARACTHRHTHTYTRDLVLPELCLFFPELGNEETNGVRITVFFCIVSQTAWVKPLHQLTFVLRQGGLRQPTTTQVGTLKHATSLLQGGSPPRWGTLKHASPLLHHHGQLIVKLKYTSKGGSGRTAFVLQTDVTKSVSPVAPE